MLCSVHAALWGQLRKHPVCGCFRSCSRLRSSSRSQDVRPFLPRASALSSRQTAFSVLPECPRWLRPTSWSDSLPSAASPVPSLARLIRVFFHVQYLTFCGYYWHLHGSAFRLLRKQTAKLNIMFALANLILDDRPHLAV